MKNLNNIRSFEVAIFFASGCKSEKKKQYRMFLTLKEKVTKQEGQRKAVTGYIHSCFNSQSRHSQQK
jgi:hypothetical protein